MKNKFLHDSLKLYFYVRREGIPVLAKRALRAVFPVPSDYGFWRKKHRLTARMAHKQRELSRDWNRKIGIYLLNKNQDKEHTFLEKSLKHQTAAIGEICGEYKTGKEDYVLLAGSDIFLSANALFEFVSFMEKNKSVDIVYCDHDEDGEIPYFKPDFNRDYLLSYPYIGSIIVVRSSFLDQVLLKHPDLLSQPLYGIILWLTDDACHVGHIPKVLYHEKSCSHTSEYELNLRCLQDYLTEKGISCHVGGGLAPGTFDVDYVLKDQPLISVIIPNRNHEEDLRKCVASIQKQSYKNVEIIITENNSTDAGMDKCYADLEQQWDNVKVVRWNHVFNYSAVNNFAAGHCNGSYYLFMNNDIEFIEERSIERMLGLCQREDTGAVGIKLLYPTGNIQHAGVIMGYGGIAGHAFLNCPGDDHGYMNRIDCVQEYCAVTAACMLMPKPVFRECGGFDEKFQIAFNDIDLCLRIKASGYKIVYTPYGLAWHYESKSRGTEDTFAKMRRFNQEVDLLCSRWKDVIRQGDFAYNPNLSLERWDFSIKS